MTPEDTFRPNTGPVRVPLPDIHAVRDAYESIRHANPNLREWEIIEMAERLAAEKTRAIGDTALTAVANTDATTFSQVVEV